MRLRSVLTCVVVLGLGLGSKAAWAQPTEPPPPPPPAPPPPPPPPASVEGAVSVSPTQAVVARGAVEKAEEIPDHEQVVNKLAVGYLGLTQVPIGQGNVTAVQRASVDAPVIGVRYWVNPKLGIDAGLGFAVTSASRSVQQNNTTTDTDQPSPFGFAVHGGVPLVFGYGRHYKFLAIPELNLAFARQSDKQTAPGVPDINRSGFRFDLGARVGSEIHFGFIGVPQLSLQATVGLFFRRQVWHNSQDSFANTPAQSSSEGETSLATSVQAEPWAIFVNNISAFYYFP